LDPSSFGVAPVEGRKAKSARVADVGERRTRRKQSSPSLPSRPPQHEQLPSWPSLLQPGRLCVWLKAESASRKDEAKKGETRKLTFASLTCCDSSSSSELKISIISTFFLKDDGSGLTLLAEDLEDDPALEADAKKERRGSESGLRFVARSEGTRRTHV